MKKIAVLGYYGKSNFGDEALSWGFQEWQRLFPPNCIQFVIINLDFQVTLDETFDAIIFGGGDVFNAYFLQRLSKVLNKYKKTYGRRIPIYAVSVGITYPSVIEQGGADFLDGIVVRFPQDAELVEKRLGKEHVIYAPDITLLLQPREIHREPTTYKRVGLFVARPLIQSGKECYSELVHQFQWFYLNYLRPRQIQLVLIPFNTDSKGDKENDILMQRDIVQGIPMDQRDLLEIHETPKSLQEMFQLLKTLDFGIGMRYHSLLFMHMCEVPFMALSISEKVRKQMEIFSMTDFSYTVLPKSDSMDLCTLQQNVPEWFSIFQKLENASCKEKLKQMNLSNHYFASYVYSKVASQWLNIGRSDPVKTRTFGPDPFLFLETDEIIEKAMSGVLNVVCKLLLETVELKDFHPTIAKVQSNRKTLLKELELGKTSIAKIVLDIVHGLDITTVCKDFWNFIARTISFYVTGEADSEYVWGLATENLPHIGFHLKDGIVWIFKDFLSKHPRQLFDYSKELKEYGFNQWELLKQTKFDLRSLSQADYKGVHRSGWQYVTNGFFYMHDSEAPILDLFMDKTFTWMSNFYSKLDIIPFKKPWYGFMHHTLDTEYSDNNLVTLFKNPLFIESLDQCKGLFVLSEHLKQSILEFWRQDEILCSKTQNIPLHVLFHPIEPIPQQKHWSWEKFINNPDKHLTSIGAWLKDTEFIYELNIDPKFQNPLGIRKALLEGPEMKNYVKPPKTFFFSELDQDGNSKTRLSLCGCRINKTPDILSNICSCERSYLPNKFNHFLIKAIDDRFLTVKKLPMMSNQQYDKFLSENLCIVKFVGLSAANSILDCMEMKVPLALNRHPAAVEYLGPNYPLFFDSLAEAEFKATDPFTIFQAHLYLKNMDTNFIRFASFLQNFLEKVRNPL